MARCRNAYTYRVYPIDKNGVSSEPSPYDLATLLPLADDPAVAGQTIIRGIHIGQLREAIDAVRRAAGLAPAWQSYTPATGTVFVSDLVTMRDRLNEARAVLQLPAVELSPAVSVGSMIRAIQLQQLRGGVQ